MSRSSAVVIGISGVVTGFLFGNIFLIIAGSLILVNENADRQDENGI